MNLLAFGVTGWILAIVAFLLLATCVRKLKATKETVEKLVDAHEERRERDTHTHTPPREGRTHSGGGGIYGGG